MLKNLHSKSIIKWISSLKLSVLCLAILTIVVIWGTVYQSEYGLYQAQQKFFHSWIFLIFGIIPFPGTNLTLAVLFVNLTASLIFRISFNWKKSGIILIHLGILILLIGGFISSFSSIESVIELKEGEKDSLTIAYHNWELAIWHQGKRITYAIDTDPLKPDDTRYFKPLDIQIKIEQYFSNCRAYQSKRPQPHETIINSSRIVKLEQLDNEKKPSHNIPGLVFQIVNKEKSKTVLLYGRDPQPTVVNGPANRTVFSLRKKRFPLPFTIELIDFKRIFYPGSNIVKSYQSHVKMITPKLQREVLISMNKPLRYKDYSLYQSSFHIAPDGSEYSIFAVVKNSVRLFPYIFSGITFFGLILHFLLMSWLFYKKNKNKHEI